MQSCRVLWITGLSGAGKSTVANEVVLRLRHSGRPVVMLDGDELREVFGVFEAMDNNHARDTRLALAMKYSKLCHLLAKQNISVVIATISLFKEVHDWNRKNLPGYYEVYLKIPLQELRRRDPKGLYKGYDDGLIKNVAGLDLEIDEPKTPDLLIDHTSQRSIMEIVDILVDKIK